jgi:hypothetical protein
LLSYVAIYQLAQRPDPVAKLCRHLEISNSNEHLERLEKVLARPAQQGLIKDKAKEMQFS